ncbi:hypothetical protein ACLB1R_28055 [Escherichia coli]
MRHSGYLGQRTKLIIRNMAYKYVGQFALLQKAIPSLANITR